MVVCRLFDTLFRPSKSTDFSKLQGPSAARWPSSGSGPGFGSASSKASKSNMASLHLSSSERPAPCPHRAELRHSGESGVFMRTHGPFAWLSGHSSHEPVAAAKQMRVPVRMLLPRALLPCQYLTNSAPKAPALDWLSLPGAWLQM